jgi:hypothetical protein
MPSCPKSGKSRTGEDAGLFQNAPSVDAEHLRLAESAPARRPERRGAMPRNLNPQRFRVLVYYPAYVGLDVPDGIGETDDVRAT